MTSRRKPLKIGALRQPAGFTLIELLTVVGIIALLIGILIPSLSNARRQARRTTSLGTITAVETALNMFHNDFNSYPDSAQRNDRICGLPGMDACGGTYILSGAHWLARAVIGHDFQGVDAKGEVLRGWKASGDEIPYADLLVSNDPLIYQRKPTYIENTQIFLRDNDNRFVGQPPSPTGRLVAVDTFTFPILYYRANPKARLPMQTDSGGIYNQRDNELLAGSDRASGLDGWDFAPTGRVPRHAIYEFGDITPGHHHDMTFTSFFHQENVCETTGGVIKPVNAESFVLLSAGPDGVYGTDDDVKNFP